MTVIAFAGRETSAAKASVIREVNKLSAAIGCDIPVRDISDKDGLSPMLQGRAILAEVAQARENSRDIMLISDCRHDYVQAIFLSVSDVLLLVWDQENSGQSYIESYLKLMCLPAFDKKTRRVFVLAERLCSKPRSVDVGRNITLLVLPRADLNTEHFDGIRSNVREPYYEA
ncbi:hypothetical protein [Agrobacterium sp. NPDC090273]|uniref:hypothetical protein n=1 Tax=Agrobacterium sp. NPDC090273 TaxID=3363919 RepID=UPI00383BD077